MTFTNSIFSHSGQKTFKTLTSPILLDHLNISFGQCNPLQKYSRTLTLVLHVDSQITKNYIRDERFTSDLHQIYIRFTSDLHQIFSTIGKSYYW